MYLEASQELSTLKLKLAAVENDLTSRDRELIAKKADRKLQSLVRIISQNHFTDSLIVSAIDREKLDAIETLRSTHGIVSTSLENDLLLLRQQHQNLTTDFDVQKSQLLETLLSKDRLMQDLTSRKDRTGTSEQETVESAKARSTKDAGLAEVRRISVASLFCFPPTPTKRSKLFARLSGFFSPPPNGQVVLPARTRPTSLFVHQAPSAYCSAPTRKDGNGLQEDDTTRRALDGLSSFQACCG